jgi:hypothetical protein
MRDRRLLLLGSVAVLSMAALAAMAWLLLMRSPGRKSAPSSLSGTIGIPVAKIIQFYATQPLIMRGVQTSLCYGVEKSISVRMEPEPTDKLDPVAFRCYVVVPDTTTQYELTATGADGREVSRTVTVTVQ